MRLRSYHHPVGCRALLGEIIVGTHSPDRHTFHATYALHGLARDCPFWMSPEFTRFAVRSYPLKDRESSLPFVLRAGCLGSADGIVTRCVRWTYRFDEIRQVLPDASGTERVKCAT